MELRRARILIAGLLVWELAPLFSFAQPSPLPGGRPYPDNVHLSPPPPSRADDATMSLTTTDGRTLEGTIVGGALTVQTLFGTRDIEAAHIQSLSDRMLVLDDGFIHNGTVTILRGSILLKTADGVLTIPAAGVLTLHGALTFTSPRPPGQIASPGPAMTLADLHRILVGKWYDSQSTSWEFFQDGTVLLRQQLTGHYTIVEPNRLKLDIWMFGIQMAKVYEILDVGQDRVVLQLQGAQPLTLRRVP